MEQKRNPTSTNPSEMVISAVASYVGTKPTELDPPLADVIDPDVLDALLEMPGITVRFTYLGVNLEISSDSGVKILSEASD